MPLAELTPEDVREALRQIPCPGIKRDIVAIKLVGNIAVCDGRVSVEIVHTSEKPDLIAKVRELVHAKVASLPGVREARVDVVRPAGTERAAHHGAAHHGGAGAGAAGGAQPAAGPDPWAERAPLEGVRHIVMVASAKGGVGKSSVAVNLALALQERGRKVGLLDADVYGPSIPAMLGANAQPEIVGEQTLAPIRACGLQVMSMALLVAPEQAMVWRGPMVFAAVRQFLKDVRWSDLDILVVDMPPGTGDAQLTMVQQVPVDGVVIVTTPQEIAVADVRRGIQMFGKVGVPVLGVVENMSVFVCPHCGERADVFGHGGGQAVAERYGVPFLGEIPLDPTIRVGGDEGLPAVANPASPSRAAFLALADKVVGFVEGS